MLMLLLGASWLAFATAITLALGACVETAGIKRVTREKKLMLKKGGVKKEDGGMERET